MKSFVQMYLSDTDLPQEAVVGQQLLLFLELVTDGNNVNISI